MAILAQGRCGAGVTWHLCDGGRKLVLQGIGPMEDYYNSEMTPWYPHRESIQVLRVEEGVSTIGDYAFYRMPNLMQLELPGSLDSLGCHCFSECPGLHSARVPEGVRVMNPKVFDACENLTTVELPLSLQYLNFKCFKSTALKEVYYAGSHAQWKRIRIAITAQGNQPLLEANLHCLGADPDVALRYPDLQGEEKEAAQYLAEELNYWPQGQLFGAGVAAEARLVYDLLYKRAGEPGMYDSSLEWADCQGITVPGDEKLTGDLLQQILESACKANGQPSQCFCAGSRELTRGEAAVILAAYFCSPCSKADRYQQIVDIARKALSQGGDGKLHILAPYLFKDGVDNKPGDSTLLIFPKGSVMLIDSSIAPCAGFVIDLLRDVGVKDIHYLVASHPHSDHIGGMLQVAQWVYSRGGRVHRYWSSPFRGQEKSGEPMLRAFLEAQNVPMTDMYEGEKHEIDGVTLETFNPDREMTLRGDNLTEHANNMSIGIKFTYGLSTYLTSGDLYRLQEEYVVEKYGDFLRADVMKSNHHGIFTSSCPLWCQTVDPKIVLSENDDIGTVSISERHAHNCVAHFVPGLDGTVLISMDDHANYRVLCQQDSELRSQYHGPYGK